MSIQTISKAVGIDLGTTNSAIAIMNPTDTDIVIHRDAKSRRETTPSCVWKNPKSGEIIVGHKAFSRVRTSPKPIRPIKRSMGDQIKVMLTDEEKSPEEISHYILAEMKRQIEVDVANFNTEQTNWIIDKADITVPAYFDLTQIEATKKAGEMAGFEVLDLLHEPTAVACYYCWRNKIENGVFLVYDFGGGTFDVSVLRSTAGAFEVLGISGNRRLGGDDFDFVLAENLRERILREGYSFELNAKEDPEDQLRLDILKFLAESVKKALSTSHEFLLPDTSRLRDKEGEMIIFSTEYSRQEVEILFKPIIERTIPYCFEAIEIAKEKAGISLADVDEVILSGGSTHVPLVREMVKKALCADPDASEPRAKCSEPVYNKVDTIVALGAAIRAAAVGGLAVYNPERTVRVCFRGTGSTGKKETYIGGNVEAISENENIDLDGGRIRLMIPELGFDDQANLKEGGAFKFTKIPLQESSENILTFEVFDNTDNLVATAGRSISQTEEGKRPTGGSSSTAVLSKSIYIDVMREGREYRKELIPAMATLPRNEDFTFTHPGKTELIRLPLYERKRKIKEIRVPVPSSLPKGAPLEMNINIDQLSFITIKGKVGDTEFDAALELPKPRELPSSEEVQLLDKSFRESVAYLPAGKKNIAEVKYKMAKKSFEDALSRNDKEQALHDYEEMEEIVADMASVEGPLKPPKEFFDELVAECYEINQYATRAAAESGQPYDHTEIAKGIDAQRVHGEKAFAAGDQKAYSDAIIQLENIRNYSIALAQKLIKIYDPRSEAEKALAFVIHAKGEAERAGQLAAAQGRDDLQREAEQIQQKLNELALEAKKTPISVHDKVAKLRGRLEQIINVIMGNVKGIPHPPYYYPI